MSESVIAADARVRAELRSFVMRHGRLDQGQIVNDDTALLDERILTSLQIPELILLIESLRGEEIDVLDLQPGDVRDIDTIITRFFR